MSFWSEAVFYRPGPPPPLTAHGLAGFLDRLAACPALRADEPLAYARVNFGKRIDGRVRPFEKEVQTWPPRVFNALETLRLVRPGRTRVMKQVDLPADLEVHGADLPRFADELRANGERIPARVAVGGDLTPGVSTLLSSPSSPENQQGWCPQCWSLTVGPVELYALGDDDPPVRAAWFGFAFSGPGYLYPESLGEWIARVEDQPAVREVTDACRAAFPTSGQTPPADLVALRTQRPSLWPVGDPGAPLDWSWGPADSG